MKKRVVLITFILLFIGLIIIFFLKEKDYELEYKVDDVLIKETYDKDKNIYQFILSYDDKSFHILSYDNYNRKRKLIHEVEIDEVKDRVCLYPKSDVVKVYPVCIKNGEYISPYIEEDIEKEVQTEYKNFKIFDLDSKTFLLWNYHSFLLLSEKNREEIKLFEKDVYNLNLVMQYMDKLILPDYDNTYSFDKLYVIDAKKAKLKDISLRYSIYFDSYFLGSKKQMVYIYDKKQEQEYYINMKKGRIYKTDNKVLVNDTWEQASTYKLNEELVTFQNDNVYNYEVINNKLYGYLFDHEYETKISNMDIRTVVKVDGLDVYFISGDTLYYYNPFDGLKALISYSEWDFNYKNMVFIFN